jgi:hypothetical protein
MDPVALAALLQSGGPYALVAVLSGVVVKLWGDGKAKDERLIKVLEDWRTDTKSQGDKLQALAEKLAVLMDAKRGSR